MKKRRGAGGSQLPSLRHVNNRNKIKQKKLDIKSAPLLSLKENAPFPPIYLKT
jgi:hypothetical protein